jgi:membrane protease YdiL (CAAX protease family)
MRCTRDSDANKGFLRLVLAGIVAGLIGNGTWAWLVGMNIRHGSRFPWAVPVTAIVLFAWWKYFVQGRGWPDSTRDARRLGARANPVPDHLWGPALGAGMIGLIGVLLLQGVMARLVALPQQQSIDPSKFPLATVFAWVVMSAVVAGVVEEASFRGYIQGGIERRFGVVIAILVSGTMFGLLHFTHPEVGVALLPFYLAATAAYGGLAYATNSTYPSMVLHTFGNMWSAVGLFAMGRSEWQLGSSKPALIWESGVDVPFVANVLAFLVVATVTVYAYRALRRMRA